MVQSLATLFNRVEEEKKIPIQCRETKLSQLTKKETKEGYTKVKEGYFW